MTSPALTGRTRAIIERAARTFRARYSGEPAVVVAPGRVNLIGEHTDYNDGFVMPVAIDRCVAVAYAAREDRWIDVWSGAAGDGARFDIDAAATAGGWARYVAAITQALADSGIPLRGADIAIESDLPVGAGLSSSAALEIAVARTLIEVAGATWDPVTMARLAQHAENVIVGVACGIMDQLIVACAREHTAMLLDCRSLERSYVALPSDAVLVVLDTGVDRELASSAYNARRAECQRAVAAAQQRGMPVMALRDLDTDALRSLRDAGGVDEVAHRRALHVIEENERVGQFAAALEANDCRAAGALMNASHESLRRLFEVSSAELDAVAGIARAQAGCWGARMTGAGFGGCAVALVERARLADFVAASDYECRRRLGATSRRRPTVFAVEAAAGAGPVAN